MSDSAGKEEPMIENGVERKTLREWRDDAGLLQAELAELAGISTGTVAAVEAGLRSLDAPSSRRIMEALGVTPNRLAIVDPRAIPIPVPNFDVDGLSADAPRLELKQWRDLRCLSIQELAVLVGINRSNISKLEGHSYGAKGERQNVYPATRRHLCEVLRVRPDKLILPGDDAIPEQERSALSYAREEVRGARKALRRSYDFLRDISNVTHRAQDGRVYADLLAEIERELKGA